MASIKERNQLTQEKCKELFDYDSELGVLRYRKLIAQRNKIGEIAGNSVPQEKGYYRIKVDGKLYRRHNLIWNWHHGLIPDGLVVDHIENVDYSIGANDRIENLQLLTPSENVIKSKINSHNTSGIKGVNWCNKHNKWVARITRNGKRHYIGMFDNIEDASLAYSKKEIEMSKKRYMVDVPSGWQYGFPMEVSETITTQEIRDLLKRQKYPEKDIEFALTYMRWFTVEDK